MGHHPFIGLHTQTEKDYSVTIPLYTGISYRLRQPLPIMVIEVPTDEEAESLKRFEGLLKEELNVKKLLILNSKKNKWHLELV